MRKKFYILIMILFIVTGHVFAGTTGKIAGMVKDGESGMILPGVNVIIEFEVENRGRTGMVCPYIEFQVVTMKLDGQYTPKKWNTKPKPVEIPALRVKPFKYTLFFKAPDAPLVEPPNKVKIELHPCTKSK